MSRSLRNMAFHRPKTIISNNKYTKRNKNIKIKIIVYVVKNIEYWQITKIFYTL